MEKNTVCPLCLKEGPAGIVHRCVNDISAPFPHTPDVPEKVANPMHLRTEIKAVFETMMEPDPHTAVTLHALNKAAEEVCESLQPIFYRLIIEMLELKRQSLI